MDPKSSAADCDATGTRTPEIFQPVFGDFEARHAYFSCPHFKAKPVKGLRQPDSRAPFRVIRCAGQPVTGGGGGTRDPEGK